MTDPRKLNRYIILLIFTLGFASYANTLTGPFIFDDQHNIYYNGYIKIRNLSPTTLAEAAFSSPLPSRPVANISFALNYFLHGFWLPGFHLTNITIHCLTGLFLFLFIKRTFATPALRQTARPEQVVMIAGLSSLLWLLHPLNTQSVTYIVQRMNSMSAMFFVLGMLLYHKARTSKKHQLGYFTGCLLSGVLALGTKEIAATLPIVIFLYEWYFFQGLNRAWLKKKLPWLGVAAVAIIFIGWLYLDGNYSSILASYRSRDFTLWQRLLTEPRVICRYLALIFFPWPGLLNLDYDFPLSSGLLQPPSTILAITALTAIFLGAVLAARRHKLLSFAILWFFVNLAIESSIIPLEIIFEHRTYLPSMLLWPPLLTLAWRLPDRQKKTALAGIGIMLVLFATWTFQRNQVWADEIALNRDIVEKSPNKVRARSNLGRILILSSQEDEGLRELNNAIRLDPSHSYIYFTLGFYYLKKQHYAEAITNLTKFTKLNPSDKRVYSYLSKAYLENKQYPEAINAARIALSDPAFRTDALRYLGIASAEINDTDTAIDCFRELSQNYPNNARYRFNLGRALENAGQKQQALQTYAEALSSASDADKKIIAQAIEQLRKDSHN